MKLLKDLIEANLPQKLSQQEVLETYSHIELTDEEIAEAMISAKRKKEAIIQEEQKKQKESENRKNLTQTEWAPDTTRGYMLYRAGTIFKNTKGERFTYNIDEDNAAVFNLLCYYFSNDVGFEALAHSLNIKNASLEKGIFLAGNFGTGKSMMLQLFSRNRRQCYDIVTARRIADSFSEKSDEALNEFLYPTKNAVNDVSRFYQPFTGHCFDDLGTEDIKNHYGNKKNVLEDVIEKRYSTQKIGSILHASTNLTAQKLEAFYGPRVISRMREMFNFIELTGKDRRK